MALTRVRFNGGDRAPMRRFRTAIAAVLAMAVCSSPGLAQQPMTLADYMVLHGPDPSAHIAYGAAPLQFAELFLPPGAGPFPVVVLIHGGCFQNKYQGMPQMRGMAGVLVSQGIAVWSIEYRGLDQPGGGYPGTFQDVGAAMDMLKDQASGRHLDVSHVAGVGHSAGAYLALWLAGRAHIPASSVLHADHPLGFRAVVALGGGGDLRPVADKVKARCGYEIAEVTGLPTAERPDVYADTTPLELAPSGSRTILINGEFDRNATPQDALDYADLARRRGDSAQTIILPGASHFDEVAVTSPSWAIVLPAIKQALDIDGP